MTLKEIVDCIETFAPLNLQESYDNSGLQIGKMHQTINKALICIDIRRKTIEEALEHRCDLIISHHPLLFNGLQKISGATEIEFIVEQAIKHEIAIYSAHTHLDHVVGGVNKGFASALGLQNCRILRPKKALLKKLVTYCPVHAAEQVRTALFSNGAGNIGNYNSCSSNILTEGTFQANEFANPYVGKVGELHREEEIRIETIFPSYVEKKLIAALQMAHPYEEVAYDIYSLDNVHPNIGSGMIGDLSSDITGTDLMSLISKKLKTVSLRYSGDGNKSIRKIAICGGSGSFLLKDAVSHQADAFITADISYHQFGEYSDNILLIDAGHFETEQFTMDVICEILKENFPTFATQISEKGQNLLKYFISQ